MKEIKWKKSKKPDVKGRIVQYDLIEIEKSSNYYNVIGSIFTWSSKKDEWLFINDDEIHYLEAKSLKDAKKEFQDFYRKLCENEIKILSNAIEKQEEKLRLLNTLEEKKEPYLKEKPMTEEERKKRIEEFNKKHGITATPVITREDMIKATHFGGCINPDKEVSEIK